MAGRNGTLLTRSGALGFEGLWPQTHKCALGLTLNFPILPQIPRRRNVQAREKRQRVRGVWRNESIQLTPGSALGNAAFASTARDALVGAGGGFPRLSKTPLPREHVVYNSRG